MDSSTKFVVAAVAVAAIMGTAAVLIASMRISTHGRIIGFGVDASIAAVDWGEILPGEQVQVGFTVTNIGDRNGTLSLSTTAMPTALSLTWDAEGALLAAHESRQVTLTLQADPQAEAQDFSFDIIITLTEVR